MTTEWPRRTWEYSCGYSTTSNCPDSCAFDVLIFELRLQGPLSTSFVWVSCRPPMCVVFRRRVHPAIPAIRLLCRVPPANGRSSRTRTAVFGHRRFISTKFSAPLAASSFRADRTSSMPTFRRTVHRSFAVIEHLADRSCDITAVHGACA